MNDPTETALQGDTVGGDPGPEVANSRLLKRLRALRSAWGALSPSGLSSEKSGIAVTGRALSVDLVALGNSDDLVAIADIEARFDAFEAEMLEVAFKVPIGQLRSSLPQRVSRNRRGVLDLLDLMLCAESKGLEGTESRIPSIDYLITLLCVTGDRAIEDPIHLTPCLQELCERSGVDYDPRLPDIEAEFFAAADLYEADARGEQLNALHRRKTELGSSYFSPSVLRAIVAYNAALLERIDDEVLASQDWGAVPQVDLPAPSASAFETDSIPQIAQALVRRVSGEAPEFNPIDRIAWCLDLEFPDKVELQSLLGQFVGHRENIEGTTILVGLLCRSVVVLEEELPAAGISPDHLTGEWVTELADELKQRVNQRIASDHYEQACVLSELKNKFLYYSMADVSRGSPRRAEPDVASADASSGRETSPIADPVLESEEVLESERSEVRWRQWFPTASAGIKVLGLIGLLAFGWNQYANRELAAYDRNQLGEVSQYLSGGKRNSQGSGPAFVGRLREGFSTLQPADRTLVATDLVGALREQGITEIMIYDDSGALRIQAFGDRPPQVIPAL